MTETEQTQQQIERFLKKVAQKFTANDCDMPMTDIHLRVSQDSGDLMAFDDGDDEITRCVIDQWIDIRVTIFIKKQHVSCVQNLIVRRTLLRICQS